MSISCDITLPHEKHFRQYLDIPMFSPIFEEFSLTDILNLYTPVWYDDLGRLEAKKTSGLWISKYPSALGIFCSKYPSSSYPSFVHILFPCPVPPAKIYIYIWTPGKTSLNQLNAWLCTPHSCNKNKMKGWEGPCTHYIVRPISNIKGKIIRPIHLKLLLNKFYYHG